MRSISLLAILLVPCGCAAILGIEEAECDVTLDPSCDRAALAIGPDDGGASSAADSGVASEIDRAQDGGSRAGSESGDEPASSSDGGELESRESDAGGADAGGQPVDAGMIAPQVGDAGNGDTGTSIAGDADVRTDAELVGSSSVDSGAVEGIDGGATSEDNKQEVCEEYCTLLETTCVGDIEQFKTHLNCTEVCTEMMLSDSELEQDSNNTIECRIGAARDALEAGEEAINCEIAGMWGVGVCGDACDVYCGYMARACNEQFLDMGDCIQVCNQVPIVDIPFNSDTIGGNHLQCRVGHLRLATTDRSNASTHCGHAAGAAPCAP